MYYIIIIIIIILLLLSLITLKGLKLATYFNTFMFLAKKKNYDKANYISNSSFFKYFYSNKLLYGYLGFELFITIILIILSIIAYFGYIFLGSTTLVLELIIIFWTKNTSLILNFTSAENGIFYIKLLIQCNIIFFLYTQRKLFT